MSPRTTTLPDPRAPRRRGFRRLALIILATTGCLQAQFTDYTELDLEALSLVRISTLARKQTPLVDTAAAATIITNDDIHRSGAMDFAETLRQVPGLHVARINAVDYAISIRGFNDATSNKLLVLMDGRSLYSTTLSGAHWNFYELVLEDVERIEVLRGPGASLWGANAMNGVINIVSKDARDTIGSMASVAFGDELQASVTARHGWRTGESGSMRAYARYQEHDNYGIHLGNASDGWDSRLGGVRYDWHGDQGGHLTLIGEHRELHSGALTLIPDVAAPPSYATYLPEMRHAHATNVSARWAQPIHGGEISGLATYDRLQSEQIAFDEERDTISLDLQLTLRPVPRHEVIAGATYREDDDQLRSSVLTQFADEAAKTTFTGVFVQDEFSLIPNRLSLTLGTKFERNSFSGWETQPALRGIWRVNDAHRSWFGISRAARTPSRAERSVNLLGGIFPPTPELPLPVELRALGSDDFSSEHVISYELGHRYAPNRRLSFDLALFLNRYDDLRGIRVFEYAPDMTPVPHLDLTFLATNNVKGTTAGGELSARWQPASAWTIEGSFAAMDYDLEQITTQPNPLTGLPLEDPTINGWSGSSPRHESKLRVMWDPHPRWSADLALRHIGQLRSILVDAYTGLDLRFAWRWRPNVEIELIGRDLLEARHAESATSFLGGETPAIARSVFLRATWRH